MPEWSNDRRDEPGDDQHDDSTERPEGEPSDRPADGDEADTDVDTDTDARREFAAGDMLPNADARDVTVETDGDGEGLRFVAVSGRPHGEPIRQQGPFVL